MRADTADTADAVGARIAARLGELRGRSLAVESTRLLPAGASRTTYAVRLVDGTGTSESVVVRTVPAAGDGDGGLGLERMLMAAAATAGVPVPVVLADGGSLDVLGCPYLVMNYVPGESIPRRILRDPEYAAVRASFAGRAGEILAAVHRIDPDAVPGLPALPDPLAALRLLFPREFERLPPGLALAVEWLAANPPEPVEPTVVHGDFRLGNLLVAPDGITAVLDWELAHLGDPMADLGWLCAKAWRFGAAEPVAGMGTRAELLDAYGAASGRRPSEDALRWWELFATVRWGLMCGYQAARHLDGRERSVELAAIGRRSAEQEYDALLQLGILVPETVPDPLDLPFGPVDESPHGSPTSDELLAAVAEFLRSAPVAEQLSGQARLHARVAANVVDIVRRQRRTGPTDTGWDRAGRPGDPATRAAAIAADVRARLLVANPRYLGQPYG